MIRRPDHAGRVVLPAEMRLLLGIKPGDFLEFFKDNDKLIVRKQELGCIICGSKRGISIFKDRKVCSECLTLAAKRIRTGQRRGANGVQILTGGREFDIDKEDVERQAMKLEPVDASRRGFYVRIDGRTFIAKNLVAATTNVPEEDLTTLDAYYILAKLGFDVFFKRPAAHKSQNSE